MTESVSRVRRGLMQGGAAVTALGALGFPAISRGQADAIRIGHLTPRTGFLGPLGEYAVMGVKLAVEEINAAGGVMGRKIELIAEDSVNPQTASTKAERLIERDKVRRDHRRDQLGVGTCDRAGRAAQPHAVLQHRLQLRRAARQVVQPLHVPHRGGEHDVRRRGGPGAAARRHGQGQEVVQPDRRLRVRPRPAARSPSASCRRTAASSRPTSWCRPTPPTSRRTCSRSATRSPTSSSRISPARRSPTS